jgi:hypothetical protein
MMNTPVACAYCGSTSELTDDHIPPKNLFPKPRPENIITVKACKICVKDTSKDDEYFRMNRFSLLCVAWVLEAVYTARKGGKHGSRINARNGKTHRIIC